MRVGASPQTRRSSGDISLSRPFAVLTENLCKTYESRAAAVRALRSVSLSVPAGQFLVVRGRSGSGKTTLLQQLAGLEAPTSGRIVVDGLEVHSLSDADAAKFRRSRVGIVFQFFNLVPTLNVEHNIALPLLMDGFHLNQIRPRVQELGEQLGIAGFGKRMPSELSGGEMQRVAIARALVADPVVLLADEPTGNLDTETTAEVLTLLAGVNQASRTGIVMMTHDPEAAAFADRVIVLRDGEIIEDSHSDRGA